MASGRYDVGSSSCCATTVYAVLRPVKEPLPMLFSLTDCQLQTVMAAASGLPQEKRGVAAASLRSTQGVEERHMGFLFSDPDVGAARGLSVTS